MQLFSPDWFDALEDALGTIDPMELPGESIRLGQVVHGTPDGEVAYTIVFGGGGRARVERGGVEGATVTLVEDYETARALASGAPAGEILAAGRVKVRGDTAALLAAQSAFARVTSALAALEPPALDELD